MALTSCTGEKSTDDNFLFGLSERYDRFFGTEQTTAIDTTTSASTASNADTPTCSTDVTVSTKIVSLSEDGDVNALFNTTNDNGLAETDTDGGTSWGYRSYETCVYLNTTFTGTVEIPLSTNSTYTGRITTQHSYYSGAAQTTALPTKLSFTASGVANRQCIKFTRVIDAIRNTPESAFQVTLGNMIQKNGSGDTVTGFYTDKDVCDISMTMDDDEAPGVRVSNISRIMEEPGAGATAPNGTFLVVLRTAPTADVTIPMNEKADSVNANNREGTMSPTTLTFTTGNWNVNQTVTVTSVDDLEIDGTKTYFVVTNNTSSTDSEYNGINPRDVVIYNKDLSVPGYAIEKWNAATQTTNSTGGSITGFATDEANQMGTSYGTLKLKLRTKPTGDVTINFSSNCGAKCSIQTPSLVFTTTNWNVYQDFSVRGAADGADGGNQDYTVTLTASSTDTTYNTTVAEPSISVRSCDNDNSNLIQPCNFSGSSLGTSGSRFSGAEPSATSNIWLITKASPSSDVTVGLASTDTTEGTVPANVTVTSANYNTMVSGGTNEIVLTRADDAIVDGPQTWTVTTAAATGGLTFNTSDIEATTTDNENYFYVSVSGSTSEASTATVATVNVCLGANNPNQPVTLTLACTNAGDECGTTFTPTSIVFPINSQVDIGNASNAGCASDAKKQSFTIDGLDDTFADGSQTFTVTMTKVTTETNYSSAPATVATPSITNADNEPAGKAVFVTSASYNGEMTAQGVLGADSNCNSNKPGHAPSGTYKALIASDSASTGDSPAVNARKVGTNWVISPNLYYYRCESGTNNCRDEGNRLFIADGTGSFNPTALSNDFSSTGTDVFWTGLTNALSPATQASTPAGTCVDAPTVYRHNCHGFTYQTCPTNGATYFFGETWTRNAANSIASSETRCDATRKLICVQQ